MRRRGQITIGLSALSALLTVPASAQDTANVANAAAPRFMIRAIAVRGNNLIPPRAVEDAVYPFTGPDRSAEDVEKARAALQALFEKAGFATVSVVIPEQGVDSGIIRLDVQPQTIGTVTVAGTDRPDRILRDAPSLKSGSVPNFQAVQRDVVALNQSPGRRVTPEVKAGVAPDTIDVTLRVQKTSPWHASAEINNYRSSQTTDVRVAGSIRYDNLWGRGDAVSLSAQVAPRRTDDGTILSASYLTHVGRVQVQGSFTRSDSDIGIVGGTSVIGKGNIGSLRVIVPLSQSETFYNSITTGVDYKDFKEDLVLGADRSPAPIQYFPFTIGWSGAWTGARTKADLSISSTFAIRGLGDNARAFDFKRYLAPPDFFYLRGDGSVTAEAWLGTQLYAHLSGQYSDSPLISNEEFSVGGIDTVRGYFESETLGDYGAAVQYEVRSPSLLTAGKPIGELRGLVFVDTGFSGIQRPLPGQVRRYVIGSAGGGIRIRVFNLFRGSLDVGVPLADGLDTDTGKLFARFRIWGEF